MCVTLYHVQVDKSVAEGKLEKARPALEEAEAALQVRSRGQESWLCVSRHHLVFNAVSAVVRPSNLPTLPR